MYGCGLSDDNHGSNSATGLPMIGGGFDIGGNGYGLSDDNHGSNSATGLPMIGGGFDIGGNGYGLSNPGPEHEYSFLRLVSGYSIIIILIAIFS